MSENKTKYVTIKVKEEVRDSLAKAANLMNAKEKNGKTTVASLVAMLAQQYDAQLSPVIISSNRQGCVLDGVPVILDSTSSKNFNEIKYYEPVNCVAIVSNFLANEALTMRLKKVTKNDNK